MKVSNLKALVLLFKATVGISILTYTKQMQIIGIVPGILSLLIAGGYVMICYFLVYVVADKLDHQSPYIEMLAFKALGARHRTLTKVFNSLMLFFICLGSVLISMMFFRFSVCSINADGPLCTQKPWLYLIALGCSLSLCFID